MYSLISLLISIVVLYAISQNFDLFWQAVSGLTVALLLLINKIANKIQENDT